MGESCLGKGWVDKIETEGKWGEWDITGEYSVVGRIGW